MGKKKTKPVIVKPSSEKDDKKYEFEFMDVKFPWYFKDPKWIQTRDGTFCLSINTDDWNVAQKSQWNTRFMPVLMDLGKKILEKHLKTKIDSP